MTKHSILQFYYIYSFIRLPCDSTTITEIIKNAHKMGCLFFLKDVNSNEFNNSSLDEIITILPKEFPVELLMNKYMVSIKYHNVFMDLIIEGDLYQTSIKLTNFCEEKYTDPTSYSQTKFLVFYTRLMLGIIQEFPFIALHVTNESMDKIYENYY